MKKTGTELTAKLRNEKLHELRQHNRFNKKIAFELKANCRASQWWQLT